MTASDSWVGSLCYRRMKCGVYTLCQVQIRPKVCSAYSKSPPCHGDSPKVKCQKEGNGPLMARLASSTPQLGYTFSKLVFNGRIGQSEEVKKALALSTGVSMELELL